MPCVIACDRSFISHNFNSKVKATSFLSESCFQILTRNYWFFINTLFEKALPQKNYFELVLRLKHFADFLKTYGFLGKSESSLLFDFFCRTNKRAERGAGERTADADSFYADF